MSTEELETLLALQEVDTHLDQLRHRRASLAERVSLGEVEGRISALRSELDEVGPVRDEVLARQAQLESELAGTEDRAKVVSRRLYSGEVSASRDLQAMSDDLEALKRRASELEEAVLEVMEELEPLDRQLAAAEPILASLAEERGKAAGALESAERVVDQELSELDHRRRDVARSLSEAQLGNYERLRSRLDGVAVARLVGNRCDGCHLSLPATELDRIRHTPAGQIVHCEQCGRILVR